MTQSSDILDSRVEQSLREACDTLTRGGKLLSTDLLTAIYNTFRAHFGPDTLRSLDGAGLQKRCMHTAVRRALVYWLEFKNDDEFPDPTSGSISGGSAHKFGLFRCKDTGQRVVGGTNSEKNISDADPAILARKHREQLLFGVWLP